MRQPTQPTPTSLEVTIEDWPFVQVPSTILIDNDISDSAVRTYSVLHLWGRNNGRAWPNRRRLCQARGVSYPTIKRHLQELEKAGWIKRSTEMRYDHRTEEEREIYLIEVFREAREVVDEAPEIEAEIPDEETTQCVNETQVGEIAQGGGLNNEPGGLNNEPGGGSIMSRGVAQYRAGGGSISSPKEEEENNKTYKEKKGKRTLLTQRVNTQRVVPSQEARSAHSDQTVNEVDIEGHQAVSEKQSSGDSGPRDLGAAQNPQPPSSPESLSDAPKTSPPSMSRSGASSVKSATPPPRQQGQAKGPQKLRNQFADELLLRWADSMPKRMNKTMGGKLKNLIASYPPEDYPDGLQKMVRVLVWDWEAFRETYGWGSWKTQARPDIQALIVFADKLAGLVGTGCSSATHRSSKYAQRYLKGLPPGGPGVRSAKDILLGRTG